MRPFVLAAFASLALASIACTAAVETTDAPIDESEADITSASKQGCGASYTPALRKYELAVYAAKAIKAKKVCEPVENPKDKSSVDATHEAVGELLQESVAACPAFRDVYKTSPYAAPARDVLAQSLLGEVVSGALDTKTFSGLDKALVGKTMFGPKPGVANLFDRYPEHQIASTAASVAAGTNGADNAGIFPFAYIAPYGVGGRFYYVKAAYRF